MLAIVDFLVSMGVSARLEISGPNYVIVVDGKRNIINLFMAHIVPLR